MREHDDRSQDEEIAGLVRQGARVMERARAARAYLETTRGNEEAAAVAFMELFHPDASEKTKQAVRDAGRDLDRRRR